MDIELKLSVPEFDQQAIAIEASIREKFEFEKQLGSQVDAPILEGDIWASLANVDSKAAFKALSAANDIFGEKLPPALIKKGGYETVDQMISDLLPKLRAACRVPVEAVSNQ